MGHIPNSQDVPGPLVIFGTGGSGTRVIARIARQAGYWMGDLVNASGDALHIAAFLDTAIDPYLCHTDWINEAIHNPNEWFDNDAFESGLRQAVARHRKNAPNEKCLWGWKNPRCLLILPLLHSVLPNMKVVHVVRDGRDMAYSKNQNQLDMHGHYLRRCGISTDRPRHERSIALWSLVNRAAAVFGQRHLGHRHQIVRFEDLCKSPETVICRMYEFLNATGPIDAALACVRPPTSLGRWRRFKSQYRAILTATAAEALTSFGYSLNPHARSTE